VATGDDGTCHGCTVCCVALEVSVPKLSYAGRPGTRNEIKPTMQPCWWLGNLPRRLPGTGPLGCMIHNHPLRPKICREFKCSELLEQEVLRAESQRKMP